MLNVCRWTLAPRSRDLMRLCGPRICGQRLFARYMPVFSLSMVMGSHV